MDKIKKIMTLMLGSVIIAAMALGSIAFVSIITAKAADEGTEPQGSNPPDRNGGFPGNPANDQKISGGSFGNHRR